MEVKIESTEKDTRELQIAIPNSDMENQFNEAYKKYRKNIAINGFRKGRVPLGLIKRMFGDKIQEEVIETAINDGLRDALMEHDVQAITTPQVDDISYKPESGLTFKATVEVAPEYESITYKDFKFEKEIFEIDDSDVEDAIERIRQERATIEDVNGEIQQGHFVISDFQKLDAAGVPLIGEKMASKVTLVEDSDENKYSLALVGAKVGDKRKLTISAAPPDQPDAEKVDEYFEVEVKEVKARVVPELTEEFVKTLGDFENVEAFTNQIKDNITREAESYTMQKYNNAIADEVVKSNPIDLPEPMVENYLDMLVENAKRQSKEPVDEDKLREQHRADAIWSIKWRMIKEKIVELEALKIEEKDFEDYFKEISESSKIDEKQLRGTISNR